MKGGKDMHAVYDLKEMLCKELEDYGKKESVKQTMDIPGLVTYDYYTITIGNKAWMVTDTDSMYWIRNWQHVSMPLRHL